MTGMALFEVLSYFNGPRPTMALAHPPIITLNGSVPTQCCLILCNCNL